MNYLTSIKSNVLNIILSLRHKGLAYTWKTYRWKMIAIIIFYYLVRDITLYVLIPNYFFKHF
jgi:hypothetical protein